MKEKRIESYYPIVGLDDEIRGWTCNKKYLHDSKQMHRAVHVFIETFGGGFILQRKGPNSENANTWSSAVSGHVEGNETYEAAAVRETKEELGLNIDEADLEEVCKISPCESTGNEFVLLFTYLMDPSKEEMRPDPEEVTAIRRLPFKDMVLSVDNHTDEYSPAFVLLLDKFLEVQGVKGES